MNFYYKSQSLRKLISIIFQNQESDLLETTISSSETLKSTHFKRNILNCKSAFAGRFFKIFQPFIKTGNNSKKPAIRLFIIDIN